MFVDIIFRLCALISHYPYDPKLSPASDFLAALNCGLFFVTMRSSAPPGVHSFSVMRPLSILGWRRTLAAHGETSSREAARKQNFSSSYGTSPPLSCLWSLLRATLTVKWHQSPGSAPTVSGQAFSCGQGAAICAPRPISCCRAESILRSTRLHYEKQPLSAAP